MKVYIVYTHPHPKSFNHAILGSFTKGLSEVGHSFEVSDLYADNLKATLDMKDLEQLKTGKIPEDVKLYQDKISACDALVFIYPIWWNDCPALLKGWFDRVFTQGFAFGYAEISSATIDRKLKHQREVLHLLISKGGASKHRLPIPLLKQHKALVINTAGEPLEHFQHYGFADAMCMVVDDGLLRFCGIQNVEHVIFYNVINTDDDTRKGYLERAYSLGKEFS